MTQTGGWVVNCVSENVILNTSELETWDKSFLKWRKIGDRLPDAVHGNNYLILSKETDTHKILIRWTPWELIRGMDLNLNDHKNARWSYCVQARDACPALSLPACKTKIASNSDYKLLDANFDWTFFSVFLGAIEVRSLDLYETTSESSTPPNTQCDQSNLNPLESISQYFPHRVTGTFKRDEEMVDLKNYIKVEQLGEEESMPQDLLRDTSLKILDYYHAHLISDDLGDNGDVYTDIKFRMMPSFWLVLMRQRIRVDGVSTRTIDVKWFHQFDKPNEILREVEIRETAHVFPEDVKNQYIVEERRLFGILEKVSFLNL